MSRVLLCSLPWEIELVFGEIEAMVVLTAYAEMQKMVYDLLRSRRLPA